MAKQTKGRIKISASPREGLALAAKVYKKHLADGKDSLLNSLDGYDWSVSGPKIDPCLAKHEEAEELHKKAEEAYRVRDASLGEIVKIVRASKTILKGKYSKNPKMLGEWGFEVDDTPKQKKKPEQQ